MSPRWFSCFLLLVFSRWLLFLHQMWSEHLTDVGPQQVVFFSWELLFFAQSVFVGRSPLLAEHSRCLELTFGLHCCVGADGFEF